MKISALVAAQALSVANKSTIDTTSGRLVGIESNGVRAFTGIRYAQAPVNELRWEPPVPFASNQTFNVSTPGPACLQQFAAFSANITIPVFNNPPPPSGEDEDCLFLNVWAPTGGRQEKPVVIFIHGGAFAFGSATLNEYNGESIAGNQDIIMVSLNYRLNIFGFPSAPDLALQKSNLGFLDQELAIHWVQQNIQYFGGDKRKVTLMGQSAGSVSVSTAYARHTEWNPPFRAAIMMSAEDTSTLPTPDFDAFNSFANSSGCMQAPGASRLDCLKKVPAATIHNYTNGPLSGSFNPVVDNFTLYDDLLNRIRTKNTARVPVLIGSTQDDGTIFVYGAKNLTAALPVVFGSNAPSAETIHSLYPGLNDSQALAAGYRDNSFRCPSELWSAALVSSGIEHVYRYSYGAVFADNQPLPGLGAWHTSELPELFGTFNASTATWAEKVLSHTFQSSFANFIKHPKKSPAQNWPEYGQNGTVANLAYNGNVDLDNVVQTVSHSTLDSACDAFWDKLRDFRP
ncbi:alpha/beta-hydrolase [Artomyces pyxidatus]|uniref:Alpha/beta-hydrolase n=1 Tax=Artomyces pyxidatus TaxID=48021 RepID=A0ACB8T2F7_9AGAM|nr:alpha/beta-hydrolase [Artomyces pyxidatus]